MSESQPWNPFGGSSMEPQPDFRELLRLFKEYDVDYLVVGARPTSGEDAVLITAPGK